MVEARSGKNHSIDSNSQAAWLSGVFETKGSMGMVISNSTTRRGSKIYRYSRSAPFISHNNTEDRIGILKDAFGGGISKETDISFNWRVWNKTAAELAIQMRPHSPSRRTTINAFEDWLNEQSPTQRVQIARELRAGETRNIVEPEEYKSLFENPAFTAGVIDAIGHVDLKEVYDTEQLISYVYPRAILYSVNRPFLEAFRDVFGGAIFVESEQGKAITREGVTYSTLNDSHALMLGPRDTERLLTFASPYSQFGLIDPTKVSDFNY